MIEFKTMFKGWQPVTKEKALKLARHIYWSATNIKQKDKIKYINKKFKGIKFTEEELKCHKN